MISNFRVKYVRDGLIEELHEGILQGCNSSVIDETPYYIRSCAKPIQSTLLIDYKVGFTPEELALCSASHAGEECHIKVARGILDKIGLDESYLKCGVYPPLSRSMQDRMLIKGEKFGAIHNNCSGKHLGFLAICKKQGWDLDTYYEPEHPLQIEVKKRLYEFCEIKGNYPMTTDGCGVPIVSMPLINLVKGYKNVADKYPELIRAMIDNPYICGGEDRLDTEIMQNSKDLAAKIGASGLCVVYNIREDKGFAVKIHDASMPARRIAVLEIINRLGWAEIAYDRTIKTINGKVVGEITVECD